MGLAPSLARFPAPYLLTAVTGYTAEGAFLISVRLFTEIATVRLLLSAPSITFSDSLSTKTVEATLSECGVVRSFPSPNGHYQGRM